MKTPSEILDSPDSSPWLKTALRTALERPDTIDAASDANELAGCLIRLAIQRLDERKNEEN